jgi:hypothetical protein
MANQHGGPGIEELLGLDALHSATAYLRSQFSIAMSREDAKANLDARALLFNCSNRILAQFGQEITYEEVEGAVILDRELGHSGPR